jgi:AcrR family transcriptional regulator/DNA-binding MarR family transcriptional regulator
VSDSAELSPRRIHRAGEPRAAALIRESGMRVSEVQRSRMLSSAVQVVMEEGYGQMSVARVTGRAGVSRRTFYELFEDREACFLAAFDQAVGEIALLAKQAWERERRWRERLRAALAAMLTFLDEQPGVGLLVIVEALGAGPRVLEHRARLLAQLTELVDEGRAAAGRREPPPLTAEAVVGAVLSLIHARLLEKPRAPLIDLLNPLMGVVVAPYLGQGMAARELQRSMPVSVPRGAVKKNPLERLNMRITYRTLCVLNVIAEHPGASNRQIADLAGINDQGQTSRLLTRLEALQLIDNAAPRQPTGEPNEWQLTTRGAEIQQAIQAQPSRNDRQTNGIGE